MDLIGILPGFIKSIFVPHLNEVKLKGTLIALSRRQSQRPCGMQEEMFNIEM